MVPDQYSVPHLRFWTVQPDSRIFSFPKYNVWDAVPLFVVLFHETVLGVDLHSLHTPCALLAQRFQTCLHYTHNSLQLPVAHFVRLNSVLQLLPACLMVARIFSLKVCTSHLLEPHRRLVPNTVSRNNTAKRGTRMRSWSAQNPYLGKENICKSG